MPPLLLSFVPTKEKKQRKTPVLQANGIIVMSDE